MFLIFNVKEIKLKILKSILTNLNWQIKKAKGRNRFGPMKSLEEEPGGSLTHKVYARCGHHGGGDGQLELELGLVQQRSVRQNRVDLVLVVRTSFFKAFYPKKFFYF